MDFSAELMKLFPMANSYVMAGALILARMLGFFRFAPVFSRKEIPTLVKIPIALLITGAILPLLSPEKVLSQCDSF